MARDIVQICNEAISDLPAHPITDINDISSKEARECARHLPGVVSDLIGIHDYGFVRRREALAVVANDRAGEWAFAYALPNAIVSPLSLVFYNDASFASLWAVSSSYFGTLGRDTLAIEYEVANGILYTDLEDAILEFSTDALEPNKWSPLFAQAVIRTLSSRIYRPILGEKADTQEWVVKNQAAQRAVNEAVADDLNRNPRHRKPFLSEGAIARGVGWLP